MSMECRMKQMETVERGSGDGRPTEEKRNKRMRDYRLRVWIIA